MIDGILFTNAVHYGICGQKGLSRMAKIIVTVFTVICEMSIKLPIFSFSKCIVYFFNSSTRFVENLLCIDLALHSI